MTRPVNDRVQRRAPQQLNESLGFNLYRCALLFRRELLRALAEYHLTPEQWQVLSILDEADEPISQTEVVRDLMKDRPTVTRIMQRLERDGWVRRSGAPDDARAALMECTPQGSSLCARIPALLARQLRPVHERLGMVAEQDLVAELRNLRRIMGDTF